MKINTIIKYFALVALSAGITSCEDFLDRPTEDNYNVDNFYKTNEQCFQAANTLYNSPWYDFQRGFIKVGEVMSGNYYMPSSPYLSFTINSSDEDLTNMSASLWSVNAYCNSVIENINTKAGPAVSEEVKNTVKGEALVWKAMTYFYLVRTFGAVPIVHDNSAEIAAGNYNDVYKAKIENVYDYIIMTLKKAVEWLPEHNDKGRIDRYSAYGLLAKVYLTKSGYGMNGSRNQDDLDKAATYARKVIYESGRQLMPVYSDIFRLQNNFSEESLIAWHWVTSNVWTSQNSLQSDLAMAGFTEFGDTWGDWGGPSVDLQDAFGEDALSFNRQNRDARRKATMMMVGDFYDYFFTNVGGLNVFKFIYSGYANDGYNGPGEFRCGTGANCVKHLVGNNSDHIAGCGTSMEKQKNSLSTHLLRLADVYLIYAEAKLGNNSSTSDAEAVEALNAVRRRSISGYQDVSSFTWEDVWKERRKELACEGDRWYDYVRWHYYEPQKAIAELTAQRRSVYNGLNGYYKTYYESGSANLNPDEVYYDKTPAIPNINDSHFTLPFPDTDLTMNRHLLEEPVEFDLSTISY